MWVAPRATAVTLRSRSLASGGSPVDAWGIAPTSISPAPAWTEDDEKGQRGFGVAGPFSLSWPAVARLVQPDAWFPRAESMQLRRKLRGMALFARPDAEHTFRGAWKALPPAEREVIETIVRDGLSVTRCATRLGLDVENVRRLTLQGMRRLRAADEMDRASAPGFGGLTTTSLVGRTGLEPTTDGP